MELVINRLSRKDLRVGHEEIGNGLYSNVYSIGDGQCVKVIKMSQGDNWRRQWIEYSNEVETLKNLTGCGVTPYFFDFDEDEDIIYMEEIEGEPLNYKLFMNKPRHEINAILKKVEDAFMQVVNFGYLPQDLHADNIMYHEGNIYFVDLGRFIEMNKVKAKILDIEMLQFKDRRIVKDIEFADCLTQVFTKDGGMAMTHSDIDRLIVRLNERIYKSIGKEF